MNVMAHTYMSSVHLLLFGIAGLLTACASYRGVTVTEAEPSGCVFRGEITANQTCNDVMDDLKKEAFQLGGDTLQCCWEGEVRQLLMRDRQTGRICDYLIPYYARVYSCKKGHNNSLQPIAPKVGAPAE